MTVLLLSVLVPFVFGAALSLSAASATVFHRVTPAAMALAVFGIYVFYEGLPPLPPVNSKQKLTFLFLAVSMLAVVLPLFRPRGRGIATGGLLLIGFGWLIQGRLMRGDFQVEWLLPLLTIAVLVFATTQISAQKFSRFAWPVTLLILAMTASFVALLGGILGVGQVLVSVAALLGGFTLGAYAVALRGSDWVPIGGTYESGLITLGVLLIQMSTFATNLSLPAFISLLVLSGLPFASRIVAPRPIWRQPFLFAALGLVVGGPAILMAVWNFQSI